MSNPYTAEYVGVMTLGEICDLLAAKDAEIARLMADVNRITDCWSIVSRHVGNWREFPMKLTPDMLERRRLIAESEFDTAVRAIMERDALSVELTAERQKVQELRKYVMSMWREANSNVSAATGNDWAQEAKALDMIHAVKIKMDALGLTGAEPQ